MSDQNLALMALLGAGAVAAGGMLALSGRGLKGPMSGTGCHGRASWTLAT